MVGVLLIFPQFQGRRNDSSPSEIFTFLFQVTRWVKTDVFSSKRAWQVKKRRKCAALKCEKGGARIFMLAVSFSPWKNRTRVRIDNIPGCRIVFASDVFFPNSCVRNDNTSYYNKNKFFSGSLIGKKKVINGWINCRYKSVALILNRCGLLWKKLEKRTFNSNANEAELSARCIPRKTQCAFRFIALNGHNTRQIYTMFSLSCVVRK